MRFIWSHPHWLSTAAVLSTILAASGCIPTVSMHKYRDVEVSIWEKESGRGVAQAPFWIVYTNSPIDSPLVYHFELRTPKTVESETNSDGRAVVHLADYAWDILLFVNERGDERRAEFSLSKELVRNGGVVTSYSNPRVLLELRPVDGQNASSAGSDSLR